MQTQDNNDANRLLRAVAEQLKLPLLQMARQAELLSAESQDWRSVQTSADIAITLVDSYLFGLEFVENQTALDLEPVSITSVLNDVAHQLSPLAKQYDVDLELALEGKPTPVMAQSLACQTALASLGYALISSPSEADGRRVVTLLARRSNNGMVAGLFGTDISAKALRTARKLYGRSRQPLTELGSAAAGIFVADMIFEAMAAPLRATRYHQQSGLAALLPISHQLQLV